MDNFKRISIMAIVEVVALYFGRKAAAIMMSFKRISIMGISLVVCII